MGYRLIAAAGAIGLIWWGSHSSGNSSGSAQSENTSWGTAASTGSADGDLADTGVDTSGIKGGETYDEYDTRRDQLDGGSGSFADYGCTQDCSGHEAGYQWAEAHGITDENDCGGNSWSFQEGCVAYAQEESGQASDVATSSDDEDDDATTPSDDDEDGPSSGSGG